MSSFGPHFIAGTTVGVIGTVATGVVIYPNISAICTLPLIAGIGGALTPDMDIKSKSSMFMYLLYAVSATILFLTGYPGWAFLLLMYSLIPQFFGHRGFIHSFIFCLISTSGLFGICSYNNLDLTLSIGIAATYFVGFLSHIALDEA